MGTPTHATGEAGAAFDFGETQTGRLMAAVDWEATSLGPPEGWPAALRTSVGILLNAAYPMFIAWGPDLVFLYNDGYVPVLGDKHPEAMGRPFQEIWNEIWDYITPIVDRALEGEGTYWEDLEFILNRAGFVEQTYFTFSYFPLQDGAGEVGGIMCACNETTDAVVGARRLATLRALSAETGQGRCPVEVCRLAADAFAHASDDLPHAGVYLADASDGRLRLTATAGAGAPLPEVLAPASGPVDDEDEIRVPVGAGATPRVLLLVRPSAPWTPHDAHRDFVHLVAERVGAMVAAADAYEAERQRADALAELDRAKTDFFSNVSHEFRTPLSLLIGPVSDALTEVETAEPTLQRERLEIAGRNARRLLRLVNSLLDVTRLEGGRIEPDLAPTDLAEATGELASVFRSAVEAAGLRLDVTCPPLSSPVLIDRGMWEKIVLNLISNAFKFTFEGGIAVSLTEADGALELAVRDTGVGVPAEQLPFLFERFHRVRGGRARTHEGTGIGLALVRELARAHGGDATAESALDHGTVVRVRLPLRAAAGRVAPLEGGDALAAADEARRWLPQVAPDAPTPRIAASRARPLGRPGSRILLADDNADMRDYLARLLGERWTVEAHGDGAQALAAARANPPDLVLSDVMMPGMDGFALLAALRADPVTRSVPVMLLSARAGEEAVLDGIRAGADDYMVKPFSSQELLTRVGAHLELSSARAEVAELRRRAHMASLVSALQDGVASLRADGTVVEASDRLGEIAGVRPAALDGRTLPIAWPAAGPDTWAGAVAAAAASGRHVEIDGTLMRSVGDELPVLLTLSPMSGEDGVVALATVKDVRERFALQRAKHEFASLASHELRTPLASVLGFLDLAIESGGDPEARACYLEIARRNAGRLQRLTQDVLDLSQSDAGRLPMALAPLALAPIIHESVAIARPAAEAAGLVLGADIGVLPRTDGDAGRLRQVLDNLISNAVKFTPAGGEVRVAASADPARNTITIEVSDTGSGIDPDHLASVFDPFFRAPEVNAAAIPGSGLGLAMTRMIVERHGGRVEALLRPSGGTTFRVTLPASMRARSGDAVAR